MTRNGRLPVEVAEKVSDWIFEALNERPQILPGFGQPSHKSSGTTQPRVAIPLAASLNSSREIVGIRIRAGDTFKT